MRIRRNIASVPLRSAKETWQAIMNLVTGDGSVDRQQLDAAASIMESLIADERPATVPIVLSGCGPRVLIYCLYSEDAIEAGLDIDSLSSNPTAGDWRMTAPCEEDDTNWMNKSLKTRAPRITVHAGDRPPQDVDSTDPEQAVKPLEIDWGALVSP
jgi:hypothetical protein